MELLGKYFDTAFAAPDGVKKLRELILTLAMQGRLIPQDPGDQPASELLKDIEAEKKRLTKEGKIKKPTPLPEIKTDEIPYTLPDGWEWVRLGEVAQVVRGVTYAKAQASDVALPSTIELLRANNINCVINYEKTLFVPEDLVKDAQFLQAGDLLIAMSSGSPHLVGKAAQFFDDKVCTFGAFCGVIRSYSASLHYFLDRYCQSPTYRSQTQKEGKGIGIQNLNIGSLNNLLVPLPPLAEQHHIVAKVDQLMARCDELEEFRTDREQMRLDVHTAALRELLDSQEQNSFTNAREFLTRNFGDLYSVKENVAELRKGILQLAVMGKLVEQDPNDQPASDLLKEIEAQKARLVKEKKIKKPKKLPVIKLDGVPHDLPKGWEWARFQDIFLSLKYGTSKKCDYDGGAVPVLRIPNVNNGKITLSDIKTTDLTKKEVQDLALELDDILIIRSNGSENLVGRSTVVEDNAVGLAYAGYLMRVRPFIAAVDSNYIHIALESPMTRKSIEGPIRTTSGVKNVNSTEISQLLIPLPPLAEQRRIVDKIEKLMALCDDLEQQIDAKTSTQTKILNAVMSQI